MKGEEAIKVITERIEKLKEAILKESDISRQKFLRETLKSNEEFLALIKK